MRSGKKKFEGDLEKVTSIDEFSIDGTLAGNSDTAIPTEKAVKTYADGGLARVKVGSFTRDMTLASGTQSITGIGCQPKGIIFLTVKNVTLKACWGLSDGSAELAILHDSTPRFSQNPIDCIYYDDRAGNTYAGDVNSLDSDGFTINWLKTNSPVGTLTIYYMTIR